MNPNLQSFVDHLVFSAPTLDAGVKYIQQTLGVDLQTGGSHATMGTHNCLLKLGDKLYLEVIAIDKNIPKPNRPRWFELDDLQTTLEPKLLTWVIRTTDINRATLTSDIEFGQIETMCRGNFKWLISIPKDGSLPEKGIAPTFIQWLGEYHPVDVLPDSGCSLISIDGFHPNHDKINEALITAGLAGVFSIQPISEFEKAKLIVRIQSPNGVCIFESEHNQTNSIE